MVGGGGLNKQKLSVTVKHNLLQYSTFTLTYCVQIYKLVVINLRHPEEENLA